ncbi:GspE/PulE family protein [Candidatus Eisenbacteria bacterium]|uniref:GspE/PulE family protein n=1 Tax=Eiseniibacteriota bacterium TaxID=2212470 RepID=A0ABV6YPC3_UNCEI
MLINEHLVKNKLGTLLVEAGIVPQDKLCDLLDKQRGSDKKLGQVAIEMGLATEEQIVEALAKQLKIPYISLETAMVDTGILGIIPESMARDLRVLPLYKVDKILMVAMADPTDSEALKEIRFVTGCEVDAVVARPRDIGAAIEHYYGAKDSVLDAIESITTSGIDAIEETDESQDLYDQQRMSQEAPIVKLVNLMIERAIAKGASDIHVEPQDTALHIRYRVDGVLHEEIVIPRMMKAAVISRLKILAKINIAERRVPQDGRFTVLLNNRKIDLRVSTFPTVHGEKVVLRILERTGMKIPLESLGMSEAVLDRFTQALTLSHGIMLVTGPTGSGKTTTLYAALNHINDHEKNIVTLEDPVESQIQGINQGHTNPVAGFTFASGLRSILRQDPDIVMVGETRDVETAEIAIQAALTGHLVFTTVHTNDAISSIVRLIDMGIEPFLVASSVVAIVAQRLVRRICPVCAAKGDPIELHVPWTGEAKRIEDPPKPVGCDECSKTGYKGRVGLYEMIVVTDELRRMIVKNANAQDLVDEARKGGYRTMFEDGLDKVAAGATSLEEVMRVTRTVLDEDIYSSDLYSSAKNQIQ